MIHYKNHKHHTKASLSTQLKNWVKNDKSLLNLKFYCAKLMVRKSSQIWNLRRGNKYPLKVLLVVHIVYSLIRRSNSEDKNARKKNTDWKTFTGRQAPV